MISCFMYDLLFYSDCMYDLLFYDHNNSALFSALSLFRFFECTNRCRNESSDTQIGVEEASDNANTEVDSDAVYDSDTTEEF